MKVFAVNIEKTQFKVVVVPPYGVILNRYLDVATDEAFTSFVSGYNYKTLTVDSDDVTGLSDLTTYYMRAKAEVRDDYGTAESGTTTTLTDTNKSWTIDEHIGRKVRITSGTGSGQESDITENTVDTLTATFSIAPDATSVYVIFDLIDYSDIVAVNTGMNLDFISIDEAEIEFKIQNISLELTEDISEIFYLQAIILEYIIENNLQIIIRDKGGNVVEGVNCLIIRKEWTNKGSWNPNTDPNPPSPSEGDFYTISISGDNDITGETQTFETTDLLLFLDATWQLKKLRNIISDTNGLANMNMDYEVDNLLITKKSGFQSEKQILNYISGVHQYDLVLYPIISIISTNKGYAVNNNPSDRQNIYFS